MTRSKALLLVFLVLITVFRLWYIDQEFLDLAPDEAHYWEWSRFLALSYYSKGPLVAYIIAFFTSLIGNTPLGVRLGAVLLSVGTSLIIYRLTQELFPNPRLAFWAAVLPHFIPLYATGALLMTIDPPFIFFWGWSLYWAYTAITREEGWRWYGMGITFGLGFLSKYTMLFFLPSLLLYLACAPQDRWWFKKRELYGGLAVGSLFFLPVLLWNAQHDWVSFRHVFGQAKAHAGLSLHFSGQIPHTLLAFLGEQAGVISPLLFLAVLYSMGVMAYRAVKYRERTALFLSAFFFPLFCAYLLLSLRQRVLANWPTAAYCSALIATVSVWHSLLFAHGVSHASPVFPLWKALLSRPWLATYTFLMLFLSGLVTVVGHFPHLPALVSLPIPPKLDPTTALRGWKRLGQGISQWRAAWPHTPLPVLMTDSYQTASELAFYTTGQPRTYCINLGRRQNQYDIWGGLDQIRGQDVFYVHRNGPTPPPKLQAAFQQCTFLETLPIYYKEVQIRSFFLFHCQHFLGMSSEAPLHY